jgi:hypothetical protein
VIYVMTRRHLQKARNIAQDPHVSLVVPLTRGLLWPLPPPTIQVDGRAEIRDWTDPEGIEVFRRFWIGRRILAAYHESYRRGELRICFFRITPDPVIHTYMVGSSLWQLRKRMESGAAMVVIRRTSCSPRPGRRILRTCPPSETPRGVISSDFDKRSLRR